MERKPLHLLLCSCRCSRSSAAARVRRLLIDVYPLDAPLTIMSLCDAFLVFFSSAILGGLSGLPVSPLVLLAQSLGFELVPITTNVCQPAVKG